MLHQFLQPILFIQPLGVALSDYGSRGVFPEPSGSLRIQIPVKKAYRCTGLRY